MNTTVSCELHLRLVVSSESSLPVPAGLRYDTADPYAVHATFHTGAEETVEWVFARDLLAEGLHRPTGTGDVRVWPSRSQGQGVVCIALSSPEGKPCWRHRREPWNPSSSEPTPRCHPAPSIGTSTSTQSFPTSWPTAEPARELLGAVRLGETAPCGQPHTADSDAVAAEPPRRRRRRARGPLPTAKHPLGSAEPGGHRSAAGQGANRADPPRHPQRP